MDVRLAEVAETRGGAEDSRSDADRGGQAARPVHHAKGDAGCGSLFATRGDVGRASTDCNENWPL
ncbi:hypothetical protein CBS101457_000170 [Exobasidium rhododendri]|nr:hypothetical protein CBS101457_000170 [Exobasidium rhododendri]